MTLLFVCGPHGCDIVNLDDRAAGIAGLERARWAHRRKRETGDFPTMEEQEDYWMAAYQRLIGIGKGE